MGEEMTGNEPGPPVFPPPSIESEGRREREVWPPIYGGNYWSEIKRFIEGWGIPATGGEYFPPPSYIHQHNSPPPLTLFSEKGAIISAAAFCVLEFIILKLFIRLLQINHGCYTILNI